MAYRCGLLYSCRKVPSHGIVGTCANNPAVMMFAMERPGCCCASGERGNFAPPQNRQVTRNLQRTPEHILIDLVQDCAVDRARGKRGHEAVRYRILSLPGRLRAREPSAVVHTPVSWQTRTGIGE